MSKLHVTTNQSKVTREEGDIWIENGKQWTIKNGLKRTVSKMDAARKQVFTPLACPMCNGPMKHHLDEKMWTLYNRCFPCTIDMEHEVVKAGNWAEYEKGKITANAEAMLVDMEVTLNEYIKESVCTTKVTEDGLVEKWKDANPQFLKSVVDKEVDELKTKIKKYKEE